MRLSAGSSLSFVGKDNPKVTSAVCVQCQCHRRRIGNATHGLSPTGLELYFLRHALTMICCRSGVVGMISLDLLCRIERSGYPRSNLLYFTECR